MYRYDGDHMSDWGVTLTTISTVGFWVLVIVGIVLLVRYLGRGDRPGPGPTPERLLAERFARGEIDEEEYRRRLHAPHAADGSRAAR
jgi:putative membrane protein